MNTVSKLFIFASKLAQEPPFRLVMRQFVKWLPVDLLTKEKWDVVARPHYLSGLLRGAIEARAAGIAEFCAIEFGVAAGGGLLALQDYAIQVEQRTGIKIKLIGFDTGAGLPDLCGDYRDHPDLWQPADYPMNEQWLRSQLSERTRLIIGKVSETVKNSLKQNRIARLALWFLILTCTPLLWMPLKYFDRIGGIC